MYSNMDRIAPDAAASPSRLLGRIRAHRGRTLLRDIAATHHALRAFLGIAHLVFVVAFRGFVMALGRLMIKPAS
jgi:hypothetical protein